MVTPQLSYYYGRIVERIDETSDGWDITLEGDVRIVNEDGQYETPHDMLIGQAFQFSVYEQSMTRLFFGTDENPRSVVMFLNPMMYGISDPNYEGGEIVHPQADNSAPEPPAEEDTSVDRVADGPDEEWQAAQSAPDPELTPDED